MSLPTEPHPPSTLRELLEAKLAESDLDQAVRDVLLDAFPTTPTTSNTSAETAQKIPEPVYLTKVTVRGFRGIGKTADLNLRPGPGLTVVTGPNGSGKSSFAEAVEIAFTGYSSRWKTSESTIWRDSWRNLHYDADDPKDDPKVDVDFTTGERGVRHTLTRTWSGADAGDSSAIVKPLGQPAVSLEKLDWDRALELYRPFLSYSELGKTVTDRPSVMHDAVSTVLGLEAVTAARTKLRKQEQAHTTALKNVKDAIPGLIAALRALDDPRAQDVIKALERSIPDLASIRALLTAQETPPDSDLALLRRLAELRGPDFDQVASTVSRLRAAAEAAGAVAGTSAEAARQRADLLERALTLHQSHPEDRECPVCGAEGRLTVDWAKQAAEEAAALREEGSKAETARREAALSVTEAHRLVQERPNWAPESLAAPWQKWVACRTVIAPEALAERMERAAAALIEACRPVREDAAVRLAAADDRWLDVAGRLNGWLSSAEAAENGRTALNQTKKARTWLEQAHADLRSERLRPLADFTQKVWAELRQESSVALGSIELAGNANQRRLKLDVAVDGIDAPALGVMSQGELNSLALSLFLPRATTEESPFRFLLLDDPVQAMDPVKVAALARLLSTLAQERQVVVFTHDTRLLEELRYQHLPATLLEVIRGEKSQVRVDPKDSPVDQAIKEAREFLKENLSPKFHIAVLPLLCRQALEAACKDTAYHRFLASGKDRNYIEDRFKKATTLTDLAALTLFGRFVSSREVYDWIRANAPEAEEAMSICGRGAHEQVEIDNPRDLIKQTEAFAKKIERQASEGFSKPNGAKK